MRVLGIDYGSQRVGLAVSDETGSIAMPVGKVDRRHGGKPVVDRVAEVAREHGVDRVVVGLPLELSGEEGPAARRVRAFGDALGALLELPIAYEDERMTSVAAQATLQRSGMRGPQARGAVDQTAAAIILQSYLARMTELGWKSPETEHERIAETQAELERGLRVPRKRR